jgi:hypothetical protein
MVLAVLAYGTRQPIAGTTNATCRYDPPAFLGDCASGGDPACLAIALVLVVILARQQQTLRTHPCALSSAH